MIVTLITEISVVGVYDRGQPNQERIVLLVNEQLNIGQYGLMIGIRANNGTAFPVRDNLFWFGDGLINKGSWIFIYTGPGTPQVSTVPNTSDMMYTVHWGRSETMFMSNDIVPILFKTDAVQIPLTGAALPPP
jgi:hypothetical protein